MSLKGTITRLVDHQQSGTIAGEDGHDYVFTDSALRDTTFKQLSLGAAVAFEPSAHPTRTRRAEFIRLVR